MSSSASHSSLVRGAVGRGVASVSIGEGDREVVGMAIGTGCVWRVGINCGVDVRVDASGLSGGRASRAVSGMTGRPA